MRRNRILYLVFIIIVMILGVASRKYGQYLPGIISKYSGDILWALMVYLGFGFLVSKVQIKIYSNNFFNIFFWNRNISAMSSTMDKYN